MHDVPDAKEVYRFTVDQFVDMVLRTINAVCGKRKSGKSDNNWKYHQFDGGY